MDQTVITFGIEAALFALPVAPVVEILDARDVAPLPRSPAHLLGLIDRRGFSVPVVDFRTMIDRPPRPDDPDTRIIVLHPDGEEPHRRIVGLRVDRVIEVTELEEAGTGPLPEADLLRWRERMVAGIGRRGRAFVILLDVAGVFAEPAIATLARTEGAAG